jgi:hypothetical protein
MIPTYLQAEYTKKTAKLKDTTSSTQVLLKECLDTTAKLLMHNKESA